jgi:LuxR family maltose regulon positive regulatory protein
MSSSHGTGEDRTPDVVVLAGKLLPPTWSWVPVVRPRLLGLISDGVARTPVTLLSGPAGCGKTVLAASWTRTRATGNGRSAAWLSLDETDDDPATFWTYVVEALRSAAVELRGLEPPVPGERTPTTFLTQLASQIVATDEPVVLIIDNADSLTSRPVLDALDLLVQQAGPRLSLVLCARADPGLPLHRHRVAGTITEIRNDQLAFTATEVQELLTSLGAPVSGAIAEALHEQTAGWAAGVRLAAAPLKSGVDPEKLVASLAEDDGSVAQYLFEEVVRQQPARVRRFLLRISVTSELWPELVDRLTGARDSRRLLTSLARANAFVEQSDTAPGGFRVHPLFREMLRAQLRYEQPDTAAALHRTCAAWYAGRGALPEAVAHAIAAGDWQQATALLVDDLLVGTLLAHGIPHGIPDGGPGLDALPGGVPGADAAVLRAASALSSEGSPDPRDLAVAAAAATDPARRLTLRVSAAAICAAAAAQAEADPGPAVADIDAAVELVAGLEHARPRAPRELCAVLAAARAALQLRGHAEDAALLDAQRVGATAAKDAGAVRLRCRCLGDLALLEALQGHLTRALELVQEVERLTAGRGAPASRLPASAAAAAAWVHVERYELSEARRWTARAESAGQGPRPSFLSPLLAVLHSRLLRVRHDLDAAARLLAEHGQDPGLPRWVHHELVLEQARLRLAHNELAEGLQLLREVAPGTAGESQPLAVRIEAEILRACLSVDAGDGRAAVATLSGALQLGEPECLRRPFLDSPPQARWLLRTNPQLGAAGAWLNPTAHVGAPAGLPPGRAAGQSARPAPAQPLSERELEVLNHVAEMLSTEEIGAAMFISVNTVRTHIRSILRKLSADRRSQAVRRARELHMI